MPGRHHTEAQPGGSARSRIGTLVLVTVAVLGIIAGVATIAASFGSADDAPRIVVQPSASLPGPPETVDGLSLDDLLSSTPPSASATPSGSGTPATPAVTAGSTSPPRGSTATPSPTVRASGSVSTLASPAAAPAPTRSVPTELTASYAVTGTSAEGFVASITVHNPTAAAQAWTVVLMYPSGITVTGYWNATPTATGPRLSFDGGPLAVGASYTFGFQAVTDRSADAGPSACTVNGKPCDGF